MKSIIVPPGIGDGLWIAQTLDTKEVYNVSIADQGIRRGHQLWEMLPFVNSVKYIKGRWDKICTHELNTYLEAGNKLDDWQGSVNWNLPFEGIDKYEPIDACKPVVLYTSSIKNNQALRGWSLQNWVRFAEELDARESGLCFLIVGAQYDDLGLELFKALKGRVPVVNFIGQPLKSTMGILKHAALNVGFQSGIGCLSTYFDRPTIMMFTEKLKAMRDTFCRKGATNWAGIGFENPSEVVKIAIKLLKMRQQKSPCWRTSFSIYFTTVSPV